MNSNGTPPSVDSDKQVVPIAKHPLVIEKPTAEVDVPLAPPRMLRAWIVVVVVCQAPCRVKLEYLDNTVWIAAAV